MAASAVPRILRGRNSPDHEATERAMSTRPRFDRDLQLVEPARSVHADLAIRKKAAPHSGLAPSGPDGSRRARRLQLSWCLVLEVPWLARSTQVRSTPPAFVLPSGAALITSWHKSEATLRQFSPA